MVTGQYNAQITDGRGSFVTVDSQGCLLVSGLQEWLDNLVPVDGGLRVMDCVTKKVYMITRVEE